MKAFQQRGSAANIGFEVPWCLPTLQWILRRQHFSAFGRSQSVVSSLNDSVFRMNVSNDSLIKTTTCRHLLERWCNLQKWSLKNPHYWWIVWQFCKLWQTNLNFVQIQFQTTGRTDNQFLFPDVIRLLLYFEKIKLVHICRLIIIFYYFFKKYKCSLTYTCLKHRLTTP